MGAINKRNAAANFDNAFRNVGARPGGQAGAKPGTAGAAEGEDVFQRRKTRVVNYWDVSKTGGAGGARPGFHGGFYKPCLCLPHEVTRYHMRAGAGTITVNMWCCCTGHSTVRFYTD
jgi:hypothetical protein